MGIFDFLKRSSTQKEEIKEFNLNDLASWLDSKSKESLENINLELTNIRKSLEEEKTKIEENLQKLNEIKLKNPNIPERAKQMRNDNKKSFTQQVNFLLSKINFPEELNQIQEFHDSINESLDYFAKSTKRSHIILQEFFGNEIQAISTNLKTIANLIKKGKEKAESPEIEKLNELKNKLLGIQQKIKRKEELIKKITLTEKELLNQTQKIKEEETDLTKLEQSSKHKEVLSLINKKKILKQELEQIKVPLINSFSALMPALRKYERLTLEDELVKDYINNTLNTLLEDEELRIAEVLTKMKDSLTKGDLELKEKKKKKILKELNKLDKSYFESFLKKHNELKKDLVKYLSEIEKFDIIKEIEDLKQKLKEVKIKLEEDKNNLKEMTKELEQIDIDNLKKKLEKEIKEKLSPEVKIIL
ncbi:MAG: hypothetical protein ABIB47_01535 [Candidatus Woesearchaeota archaeon]